MIRVATILGLMIASGVAGYVMKPSAAPSASDAVVPQAGDAPAIVDPFPFYNEDEQYGWYDRHDRPMSVRCYTNNGSHDMCTTLQWRQALGVTLTPAEERTLTEEWCRKFAASWDLTYEQCLAKDEAYNRAADEFEFSR